MDKEIKYVTKEEFMEMLEKQLQDPPVEINSFNVEEGYVTINGKNLKLI